MNHAILINHRITIRSQSPPQSDVRIKLAILVEVDDSQSIGPPNLARFRLDLSAKQPQQARRLCTARSCPHAGDARAVRFPRS